MVRFIAAAAFVLVPVIGVLAQPVNDLVGAWTLVSLIEDHSGRIEHQFGEKPDGCLILDRSGAVAVIVTNRDRPKSAGNPGMPVGPSVGYYGAYTIEGNNLTYHVKASTYPPFEGTSQKATYTRSGDTLTLVRTITGGKEPFTSTLKYERMK